MKKISIICLAMLLLLRFVPVSASASEDISVTQGCHTLDAQMPLLGIGQLVSNASAAVLYEVNTDTLMYANNADAQVSPASLLKILTALIAIEKGRMDDVVTVREEVLKTLAVDAVVVDLTIDEVLTVKDLLYCMMVGSGNDAAVVLADHVMGSQIAFVDEMNRYAGELGCTGTNFTNVHGLHNEKQYTTARDVARILDKALENPQFCEVFNTKTYVVPATNKSEARELTTQNYLINNDKDSYYDERVTGGRTAVNNDRTRSIASVAEVNDMRVMCVVIGSKSQFEKDGYTEKVFGGYSETKQLLDLAFTGYRTAQLVYPGEVLQQNGVLNGSCDVSVGARNSVLSVIDESAASGGLVFRYANEVPLTAPIEKGQKLSDLQIWVGSVCVAQTETYAMNSVPVTGSVATDSNGNKGDISAVTVILYLIGGLLTVVFCIFIVLFVLRSARVAKTRRQHRRNSRNRRRSR